MDVEPESGAVQAHGGDTETLLLARWADRLPDLVVLVDADGTLRYLNPAAIAALGRGAEPFIGRTLVQAGLFGAEADTLRERVRSAFAAAVPTFNLTWTRDSQGIAVYAVDIVPDAQQRRALVHAREAARPASEPTFRTLTEHLPDVIIRYGANGRAVYCNREIDDQVSVSALRVVGHTPSEAAPPGMRGVEGYEAQLWRTLRTGEPGTFELQVPHPDGTLRVHSVLFSAERDLHGTISGAIAVGRDTTEQVRIREALAAREREFRTLAENADDNIVRWDEQARMCYTNPAFTRLMQRPAELLLGRTPLDLAADERYRPVFAAVQRVLRGDQPEMLELRLEDPGRAAQVHQIRFVPEHDERGGVCGVLGIGRDITEKAAYLERIEALVRTDPLTQLPNRQALLERAPALLAASRRHARMTAVLLLDLDRFKSVNDALGPAAGDELLCESARRLASCLRANDLLVRQGDDEFVVVAPDIDNAESLGAIADKLQRAVAAPLQLLGRTVQVSASIGVALFPGDADTLEALLVHAASAMQHAKRGGRGRTEYYRRELGEAVQRRLLLESALREATRGAGLVLHLQPQVSLQHQDRIIGAEALLRWQHPALGLLSPDAFIAIAEDNGSIVPIGHWVLHTAAESAVRCNRGRAEPIRIAVNVSTRQFVGDDVAASVARVLAETGCEPAWLSIEITESALLEQSARVHKAFDALHALGVRIALDDFGTGYSALNYLARFPVDCLKIDKSFVQGIDRSTREAELVKAFIAMASALNLGLVAEGVETDAQAAFLRGQGCPQAQGWLYGRPMPVAQFETLLAGKAMNA
ncbi:EAL domain-containing protein [Variovorax sp. YR752]|uniref:putative bifunctional diguanylate cyclase/phosphodiesterase n=1 Tax=Variovorax sp. YR752 TaxID=1884383 RepID=UPI003137A9F0